MKSKTWHETYDPVVKAILARVVTEEEAKREAASANQRANEALALDTLDGDIAMVRACVEQDAWNLVWAKLRRARGAGHADFLMRFFAERLGLDTPPATARPIGVNVARPPVDCAFPIDRPGRIY